MTQQDRALNMAAALETGRVGVWQWDGRARRAAWSAALAALHGLSPADGTGSPEALLAHVHPDDRALLTSALGCASDGPVEADFRVEVEGGVRWLRWQGRACGGGGAVGVCLDVTDWKETDLALRAEEQRYRDLFENANDVIFVHDMRGQCSALNRAGERLLGYSREELQSINLGQLVAPEHHGLLGEMLRRKLSEGGATTYEVDVFTKDGRRLSVEVSTRLIHRDAVPAAVQGIARDITERKRAEEVRTRLTAILEATTDLVGISHVAGPAHYVNAAGRRMLGVGPEETVALSDFRPDPWRDLIHQVAIPAACRDGVWSGETVFRSRDGREFPVSQVILAHPGPDGSVAYLSTIARDVSDRKRLEEQYRQSQKMEAVGRLAGGVAHDFNNLLTVIGGYGQLLLNDLDASDPRREAAAEILRAAERAAEVTRQLLAFGRKSMVVPKLLDLNAVVREAGTMLRRLIGEDIELHVHLAPDLPPVRVDPGQMQQVLLNLAVNARDAMPTGGRLAVETAPAVLDEAYARRRLEVRPGAYVLLTVRDTGAGMTEAVRSRLFEPFFTTKGPGKGTGLGLSTLYGIVKQAGGHVEVESEPGRGSTFRVYLPAAGGAPLPRGERVG